MFVFTLDIVDTICTVLAVLVVGSSVIATQIKRKWRQYQTHKKKENENVV